MGTRTRPPRSISRHVDYRAKLGVKPLPPLGHLFVASKGAKVRATGIVDTLRWEEGFPRMARDPCRGAIPREVVFHMRESVNPPPLSEAGCWVMPIPSVPGNGKTCSRASLLAELVLPGKCQPYRCARRSGVSPSIPSCRRPATVHWGWLRTSIGVAADISGSMRDSEQV